MELLESAELSDNYLRVSKYKRLLPNYTPSFDPFVVKKKKKNIDYSSFKDKESVYISKPLRNLCCTAEALGDFINTFDQPSQKHSKGERLMCGIRKIRAAEEERERRME